MNNLISHDFIINVGPKGTFQRSGNYQTLPENIDSMFNSFEQNNIRKIALYFHGGLVNEASGIDVANNIAPHILKADCAPVCFVWETGIIETVKGNLSKLISTSFIQTLLKYLLKRVSKTVGFDSENGRATGAGISDELIELELNKAIPFKDFDYLVHEKSARNDLDIAKLENLDDSLLENRLLQDIEREITSDFQLSKELQENSKTIYNENENTGVRGVFGLPAIIIQIAHIAFKVIKRFINKTDHGIYPTIIEEILRKFYVAEAGSWIWKSMKDKSLIMWNDNEGLIGNSKHVGRYFLDNLLIYLNKFPDTKVNLIGHSAGSIAICNLFKKTRSLDNFKFNHIVFLAPACRVDLFEQEILSDNGRFNNLRIFTMNDVNECNDILVPYFYTRSLLYLISGVLEDKGKSADAHILGLQRHISFVPPYNIDALRKINDYLFEDDNNRICFSQTLDDALEGLRTNSLSHGDFDNDQSTLESITHILKN